MLVGAATTGGCLFVAIRWGSAAPLAQRDFADTHDRRVKFRHFKLALHRITVVGPEMITVVQRIAVEWSKASRGASRAALRNAVPERLSMPPVDLGRHQGRIVVLHEAEALESREFQVYQKCEVQSWDAPLPFRIEPLVLEVEAEGLRIVYRPGVWSVGAPLRRQKTGKVFSLRPGEWGSVSFNGRFGYPTGWCYRRQIFHVAVCDSSLPERDLFLGAPLHVFRDECDLR